MWICQLYHPPPVARGDLIVPPKVPALPGSTAKSPGNSQTGAGYCIPLSSSSSQGGGAGNPIRDCSYNTKNRKCRSASDLCCFFPHFFKSLELMDLICAKICKSSLNSWSSSEFWASKGNRDIRTNHDLCKAGDDPPLTVIQFKFLQWKNS